MPHFEPSRYQPIVIGRNHYNTLGLIRSLGEAGYKPILILLGESGICFTCKSKYLNEIHVVQIENIISYLKSLRYEGLPILFPSGDNAEELIDNNFDSLKDHFFCPNMNNMGGIITKEMDKGLMRKRAQQFGFKTPESWTIKGNATANHDIKYPCIIKASASINGPKSYDILNNEEKLEEALSKMQKCTHDIIVQEFIKKDYEIIFLGYSHAGKVGIPCVMKKIREYPQKFGCTGLGRISPNIEEFIESRKLIDFVNSYNYSGLFSIEFLVSGNNVYFLEINFRNDGNGYFPGKGGVNIADNYIKLIAGENIDTNQRVSHSYNMMREFTDFDYVRTSGYSKLNWIKDILTTNVFQYWNSKDPKPFFFLLKDKIRNIKKNKTQSFLSL